MGIKRVSERLDYVFAGVLQVKGNRLLPFSLRAKGP